MGIPRPGDDLGDELSVQVIMQQAAFGLVVAVADQEAGRVVTRVERHAVGGVEFLETVPLGPKVHQVLPGLVELENMVARVAVGQEDIAVGSDRDRRRD